MGMRLWNRRKIYLGRTGLESRTPQIALAVTNRDIFNCTVSTSHPDGKSPSQFQHHHARR